MEKVDIAQQRGKSSHSAAAREKGIKWSIVEKVGIVQQHLKSNHSTAAWKKET